MAAYGTVMADSDTPAADSVDLGAEVGEEAAEPDFDTLLGVITDGFVGAVGGLVGTAAMTVVLLVAATLGGFDTASFATLAEMTGASILVPVYPAALGYVMFLAGGMIVWPLMLASIGSYLPGRRFAERGVSFGIVLWTGFAPAFHSDQTGTALYLYLLLTLVAHVAYGFTLGSVFDYFSTRPDTLV
jgi:hypothetical protein